MSFETDLQHERDHQVPRMALRPDDDHADLLDDVVVKDVQMFRMEAMSEDNWWLCCYFTNGERLTFNASAMCRPRRLEMSVVELPIEWVDIDAREVGSADTPASFSPENLATRDGSQ